MNALRTLLLSATALSLASVASAQCEGYVLDYSFGELRRIRLDQPGIVTVVGTAQKFAAGLEFGAGDTLYALYDTGELVVLDPNTAASTSVGTLAIVAGQIWTGLAYDAGSGVMYASSTSGGAAGSTLYTVDTLLGTASVVGSDPLAKSIAGIAFDAAGTLFGHDLSGNTLRTIDTATGLTSVVGPTGFIGTGPWHDMDLRASTGELFLADHNGINNANEVRLVDTGSGAAALVGTFPFLTGAFTIRDVDLGPVVYCTAKQTSCGSTPTIYGPTATTSQAAGAGSYTIGVGPVADVPSGVGILLYTTSGQLAAPVSGPFGTLCLGSGVVRVLPPSVIQGDGVGCDGQLVFDFGDFLATQTADPLLFPANLPRCLDIQAWYRDPASPGTANFSNALGLLLVP